MSDAPRNLTWLQFGTGAFGFIVILGLYHFLTNTDNTDRVTRLIGAVAYGIGSLAGALFVGFILWGIMRLFKGAKNAPEPKFFLLATACVIGVGYIALNFTGVYP